MFFRLKKNAAGPTLQLVESYRDDERRPRQRIVASLGDADIAPKDWTLLAKMIERRLRGEAEDLLDRDFPEALQNWADRIVHLVDQDQKSWRPRRPSRSASAPASAATATPDETLDGVIVDKVTHEHTAMLGPVLAGRHAWSALGMDNLLETLGLSQSQSLAAAAQAPTVWSIHKAKTPWATGSARRRCPNCLARASPRAGATASIASPMCCGKIGKKSKPICAPAIASCFPSSARWSCTI